MSQYLFSLHLNAHVMGLRPLYLSVLRPSLYSRIFIQQRHILPYKDGPCRGRVNVLNDLALTTLSLPIHKEFGHKRQCIFTSISCLFTKSKET